jgi:uncharacterized protein
MSASHLPPAVATLTQAEARRIALAAQGFGPRPTAGRSPWKSVASAIDAMALLQLDSVNVLVRSHYLPVFSRLGDYKREAIDRHGFAGGAKRQLFEYWAHEASLLPVRFHPLLRWRMARAEKHIGLSVARSQSVRRQRSYIRAVLAEIGARGPLAASELDDPGERSGPWWGWRKGKAALEHLLHTGAVTAAGRRGFERLYDLTDRIIPPEILGLPTPTEADAIRDLATAGAKACGIATEVDIRDYFRLPVAEARRAIGELVEAGTLLPVTAEGWDKPAYLHAAASQPRRLTATALLSPFDPLVWFRPRTERLFGFHYRLEIYTPQAKRKFGYYVLPFLHDGRLSGRLDLKAMRAEGVLEVRGAYAEEAVDRTEVAAAAATELRRLAAWLGLDAVRVLPGGDLAKALARSI